MTRELWTVEESEIPLLYYIGETRLSGKKNEPVNRTRYYKQVNEFRLASDSHFFPKDGFYYEYVKSNELVNYKQLYSDIKPDLDIAKGSKHDLVPITQDEVDILKDLGSLQNEIIIEDLDKTLEKDNKKTFRSQRRGKLADTGSNIFDQTIAPITQTGELIGTTIQDASEIIDSLLLPVLLIGGVVLIAVVAK